LGKEVKKGEKSERNRQRKKKVGKGQNVYRISLKGNKTHSIFREKVDNEYERGIGDHGDE